MLSAGARLRCDLPFTRCWYVPPSVTQVMVPLLTNPENQKGWPKVVCQDVEKHINELKGTIYRMVGQVSVISP